MDDQLLPCPFCGDKAEAGYEGFCAPDYRVRCECGAVMYGENELNAVEKWNKRAAHNTRDDAPSP